MDDDGGGDGGGARAPPPAARAASAAAAPFAAAGHHFNAADLELMGARLLLPLLETSDDAAAPSRGARLDALDTRLAHRFNLSAWLAPMPVLPSAEGAARGLRRLIGRSDRPSGAPLVLTH